MSYRVYPVTKVAPTCEDYIVKINGVCAETNTARVSAIPFNRRWPGHQRDISQSEPIQFLSFAMDEALDFEITPNEDFDPEKLKIRPQSLGIKPVVKDGVIRFTLPRPAYFTVEPFGRNRALHIFADPVPAYDVDKEDKNVIYFGAGEHDMGFIELKSNQTLFLDEGAVVYACVRAEDADNVRILGRGILDNSRNKEVILFEHNAVDNHEAVKNATRRHTVEFKYCNNVEVDGITIRDSLVYNIRPSACRNLKISHVKLIGNWRYNSDGIDMHNCEHVRISDCFLRNFDDCLCIKGFDCYFGGDLDAAVKAAMCRNGENYESFRDVVIERLVVWNDWNKSLEIGAETRAEEICDITFRDCDLIHVMGPALDCANVDYADVHDITYENIRVEMDEQIPRYLIQKSDDAVYVNTEPDYMAFVISAIVEYHHEYSAGGTRRGKNRHLRFENIHLLSPRAPRLRFKGYDENHKTENITIKNLTHNGVRVTDLSQTELEVNEFVGNITVE